MFLRLTSMNRFRTLVNSFIIMICVQNRSYIVRTYHHPNYSVLSIYLRSIKVVFFSTTTFRNTTLPVVSLVLISKQHRYGILGIFLSSTPQLTILLFGCSCRFGCHSSCWGTRSCCNNTFHLRYPSRDKCS